MTKLFQVKMKKYVRLPEFSEINHPTFLGTELLEDISTTLDEGINLTVY